MHIVRATWEAESRLDRPQRREQMRHTLGRIMRSAMAAGKHGPAVQAARALMDLDGLTTLNLEVSGKVEHHVTAMTSDEKRKRLEQLLGAASERPIVEARSTERKANGANGKANGANGHDADHD